MMKNPNDIINNRFGKLVVINRCIEKKHKQYIYNCKCDCGKNTFVIRNNLLIGKTKSCGCLKKEITDLQSQNALENFKIDEYIGKTFNKLKILEYIGYVKEKRIYYIKCQCQCGVIKLFNFHKIVNSETKSCGCLRFSGKNYSEQESNLKERSKFSRSILNKQVKERDNQKCYICNKNDVALYVHHVVSWKDSIELRFCCKNLITLCENCHYTHAHILQTMNKTWQQKFQQYLLNKDCICKNCNDKKELSEVSNELLVIVEN